MEKFTDCIDFIHENDTGLMVSGIVEHFTNQTSTLSNVLVHDCTGNNLQGKTHLEKNPSFSYAEIIIYFQEIGI